MRVLVLFISLLLTQALHSAESTPFISYHSDETMETVLMNVQLAVTERGLSFSEPLHIGEMLQRTAPDLGIEQQVYQQAEVVTFCSAQLTHELVHAHPLNMGVCPLSVMVFQTVAEPAQVTVAYRLPVLLNASAELQQRITNLLDGIAQDALSFF